MPLVHQCEIFADSGRVFDISETMSNLTYCNMMECVMSQTSKDSERYGVRACFALLCQEKLKEGFN